jgi:hypothetical protein
MNGGGRKHRTTVSGCKIASVVARTPRRPSANGYAARHVLSGPYWWSCVLPRQDSTTGRKRGRGSGPDDVGYQRGT